METVVKEMSHLFQFFPDEVEPLKYPPQIDLIENGGNYRTVISCTILTIVANDRFLIQRSIRTAGTTNRV